MQINSMKKKYLTMLTIYSLVVLLAGLCISSLVQGVMTQLSGNNWGGTMLYIAGLGSGMISVFIFMRGKAVIENII
ncbi:Uncharacterised protein [uncultured archaeon]|nr:Uncharacterised protein [uncultured archaeon]